MAPFPDSLKMPLLPGAKPGGKKKQPYVLLNKMGKKKKGYKTLTGPSTKRQNPIGLEHRHLGDKRRVNPQYFFVCNYPLLNGLELI
jgi:hypothetical protein